MPSTLQLDISEKILTITLHRPDRMNAFTLEMADDLISAFDEADRNDDVRAVIVTGSGKAFCAGADLGQGGNSFSSNKPEKIEDHRDSGGLVTLRIFNCRKPVISAVNGAAVGVGATMQLPMDVRIASTNAKFGFVFARRGLVPEACSAWFLPRIVGISQAMEWVMTGRVFSPEEALAGRLISKIVEPDALIPTARALAKECTENTSAVSMALSRQLLWRMLGAEHPIDAHRIDSKCIYHMGKTGDVMEGVTSFLQKRPPNFPLKVSKDMPPFFPWWTEPEFKK